MSEKNIVLNVNGIEVIYNHVILVLKGVSLQVPEQGIVALLGGNGAGKTTTLRAISNLLKGERGEVTKGSIEFRGERIENLSPADLVNRGVVQVMEGRHCFAHLTIEENLMTGSYTRTDKGEIAANLEKVYNYFPRLKTRRTSQAAYTSGGEQQMCAIGRALMANPKMVLLDEPSMGLAPQIVEEIFEIVRAQLASVGRNPFSSDEIRIIYRKPKMLVTDTEVLANLKTMTELGLLEEWEKFVIIDPNMTEEDAKAKLERIKASKVSMEQSGNTEPVVPSRSLMQSDAESSDEGVNNADISGPSN